MGHYRKAPPPVQRKLKIPPFLWTSYGYSTSSFFQGQSDLLYHSRNIWSSLGHLTRISQNGIKFYPLLLIWILVYIRFTVDIWIIWLRSWIELGTCILPMVTRTGTYSGHIIIPLLTKTPNYSNWNLIKRYMRDDLLDN